jgi:hypothetical protein
MSLSPITVTPQTHRFFNELATAQAATAHVTQAGGPQGAYKAGSPISQVCYTLQEELEFDPGEVLGPISKFAWPSVIHLKFHPGRSRPAGSPNPTGVQRLMGSLYEHAFITYYEKNVPLIISKHGGKRNWPEVLTFGRIVRDAFAHGGTVNIADNIAATWGAIRYSSTDNGRRVLYNDLSSGDLTLLMLEMDAQF